MAREKKTNRKIHIRNRLMHFFLNFQQNIRASTCIQITQARTLTQRDG